MEREGSLFQSSRSVGCWLLQELWCGVVHLRESTGWKMLALWRVGSKEKGEERAAVPGSSPADGPDGSTSFSWALPPKGFLTFYQQHGLRIKPAISRNIPRSDCGT